MYAMVCTRLDLSYAVSLLSRYMANPWKDHWYALIWVVRYVRGTKTKGVVFEGSEGCLENDGISCGYVDLDYASCLDLRKSLTGYVFIAYGIQSVGRQTCITLLHYLQ